MKAHLWAFLLLGIGHSIGCGAAGPRRVQPLGPDSSEIQVVQAPAERSQEARFQEIELVDRELVGSRIRLRLPVAFLRRGRSLSFQSGPAGDVRVEVTDLRADEARAQRLQSELRERLSQQGAVEESSWPTERGSARILRVEGTDGVSRAILLREAGALSLVTLFSRHARAHTLCDRISESIVFDPDTPVLPWASLGLQRPSIEGLATQQGDNSTQRLSDAGTPNAHFPGLAPVVEIHYRPLDQPPSNDQARGRYLGAEFGGMQFSEGPRLRSLRDLRYAFSISGRAALGDEEMALFGAYIQEEGGIFLLRASVNVEDAETWMPRFEATAEWLLSQVLNSDAEDSTPP